MLCVWVVREILSSRTWAAAGRKSNPKTVVKVAPVLMNPRRLRWVGTVGPFVLLLDNVSPVRITEIGAPTVRQGRTRLIYLNRSLTVAARCNIFMLCGAGQAGMDGALA